MIIAGGDGTLHECINGLCNTKKRPKIGYIPAGTSCDLANTLKIPKNVEKAMDIILNGVPTKMDVVGSNKGYFLYVTAIGTYVDISYVTDSKLKKLLGPLAYFLTGIKEFFTIPMMKSIIEHDEGVLKGYFSLMLVVNSKRVAGFNIIDKPILDDGKVDVVLYRYIPFFNNIIYFISFILTPKVIPGVRKFKTTKLKISTDHPHKWNMDGEEANSGSLNIDVHKQAIEIIIDPDIKKKYFKES
jgi:diacylglycerol kinase (ATP)